MCFMIDLRLTVYFFQNVNMNYKLSYDVFNGSPDMPLELVFEFTNYLLSEEHTNPHKLGLKTDGDKMMFLLYNKFKKYENFTIGDALKLDVKHEFESMFSNQMLTHILLTNDWSYDPH